MLMIMNMIDDHDEHDEHDAEDPLAGAPPCPSAQFQYPLHNNHIRVSRLKFHSTAAVAQSTVSCIISRLEPCLLKISISPFSPP